jgi:hypothetical protein
MGAVSANVAAATFYNFNPRLVARAIPAAWELASPAVVTRMRYQLVASALPRVLGEQLSGSSEVTHAPGRDAASAQRSAGRLNNLGTVELPAFDDAKPNLARRHVRGCAS